jgi:phage shock protein A
MFARIIRLIKSWIGYFVSLAEDPEVMLHQAVEEMRHTIPRLNSILVSTRATALKLDSDVGRLEQQAAQLTRSIKAALRDGTPQAREIAEDEASSLQQVRESLERTREEAVAANAAHSNAVESIDELKRRLRARIEQAQRAIEDHRRAVVIREAASALAELDAGSPGSIAEKHIEQVRQKSFEARAAMEIALASDGGQIANERRLRKAQAKAVLEELEAEGAGEVAGGTAGGPPALQAP